MTVGTGVSPLASYSYTLGAAGNCTGVTELSGRTVNYTSDDLYRLTSESIANDPHGVNGNAGYSYAPVGNRLNRSSSIAPLPSQSLTYDANDRLTSDSYDNNGDTTSASGNNYAYNFENHLTSLNGGSVRYIYDGDAIALPRPLAGSPPTISSIPIIQLVTPKLSRNCKAAHLPKFCHGLPASYMTYAF